MKKALSLLLALVLCLGLCACATQSSSPAAIVDNDGNSVSMTAKELCDIYSENKAKFDKYYYGAAINFTGTVEKIETDFRQNGSDIRVDRIIFQEGWEVYLLHGWYDDVLVELSKGTVVEVSSKIFSCFGNTVDVRGMSTVGYNKDSLKETTLKIVG